MKQTELKQIIKECVKSIVNEMEGWEPFDDKTGDMAPAPRDRTEPVEKPAEKPTEEKPEIDKEKIKKLNKILVTCGEMQKRVHSLTDETIRYGIKDIQNTVIELMRDLGAK